MLAFVNDALQLCKVLAVKAARGTLNEFEQQLYEATSRFLSTVLKFQEACSQSALIKAERELNDLFQKEGSTR